MYLETLSEEEQNELKNSWFDLMEDYVNNDSLFFSKIDYLDIISNDLFDFIVEIAKEEGWCKTIEEKEHLQDTIYDCCLEFLKTYEIPMRQKSDYISLEVSKFDIDQALDKINNAPVQRQRSAEWFSIRYNLFSASNLSKLFGSQAQYNSLIFEKCKGFEVKKDDSCDLLLPNPRNWGIKYEAVTAMLYEDMNNVQLNTKYGCIKHDTLPIGASPDGIVVTHDSLKYGYLVEIKNIYNREIHGVPKEEYWTQIQIQLEVCNLEVCDFVETRFKEYSNFEEYVLDDTVKYKGVILFFLPKEKMNSEAHYAYMPLHTSCVESWIVEKQKELQDTHILYEQFYWFLDEYSCVDVERNNLWFKSAEPIIKEGWETVLKERQEGFDHRAPKKTNKSNHLQESLKDSYMVEKPNQIPNTVKLIKLDS